MVFFPITLLQFFKWCGSLQLPVIKKMLPNDLEKEKSELYKHYQWWAALKLTSLCSLHKIGTITVLILQRHQVMRCYCVIMHVIILIIVIINTIATPYKTIGHFILNVGQVLFFIIIWFTSILQIKKSKC